MPITRKITALFPSLHAARRAVARIRSAEVDQDKLDITVLDEPRHMHELVLEETRVRSSAPYGAVVGALSAACGPTILWAMGAVAAPRLFAYTLVAAGVGAILGALTASLLGLNFPSRKALDRQHKLRGDHALVEVEADPGLLPDEMARLARLFRRSGAVRIGLPQGAAS